MSKKITWPADLIAKIRAELNGNTRRDLTAQGRQLLKHASPIEVAKGRLILELAKEPRT